MNRKIPKLGNKREFDAFAHRIDAVGPDAHAIAEVPFERARFGVHPLEFDGRHDSLFHEFDQAGRKHMEYVRDRGHYADVPYKMILADFHRSYPRWMALVSEGKRGEFATEA